MAIQVYNFKKYDGYAMAKELDAGRFELLIYLKGKSNTLATICIHDKQGGNYSFYNFILDKEHLNNIKKAGVNWFEEISEVVLNVNKITPEVKLFAEYALHCDCNVILTKKEDI